MSTYEEQIHNIEDEIRRTQKNKATETHIGRLKAKIARLKREQQEKLLSSSKGPGEGFDVKKSGDSSVALIGLPSVGKSTLLNKLCGKELSEVGHYAFTTLDAIPGIMEHEGTAIQIIDLPGIISGASKGKGKGKRVLAVARGADLLLLIVDIFDIDNHLKLIYNELSYVGIRINQKPPDIVIEKTKRGGIAIASLKKLTKINEKTIKAIMGEYRVLNANVTIRTNITVDQLIDTLEGNRIYSSAIVVINKIDLISEERRNELFKKYPNAFGISAESELNLDKLKQLIVRKLRLIRIYLKPHGGEIDYQEPLIIRYGSDIGNVCDKLHKSFREGFRYARVWGKSVKHKGQKVSLHHKLEDEDILTIIRSNY